MVQPSMRVALARMLDQLEVAVRSLHSERVEVQPDACLAGGFRNLRDQAGVEIERRRLDRDIRVQARALDGPHGCQIHVGDVAGQIVLCIPKTQRGSRHTPRRKLLRQPQGVRQLRARYVAPGRSSKQRLPR